MRAEHVTVDFQIRYYLALFLGSELEITEDYDGARKQYEQAGRLYPAAQTPLLVLSQLARRRGDLPEAIAFMERAFATEQGNDPWWEYLIANVQDADLLLTSIRIEIAKLPR